MRKPEGKSFFRKTFERAGLALGIAAGAHQAYDHVSAESHRQHIEELKVKEKTEAAQKIRELHEKIKFIDGGVAQVKTDETEAHTQAEQASKEAYGGAVMVRDKKIRDFFDKKYPEYVVDLDKVQDGRAEYDITFDYDGKEQSIIGFHIEEDGSFSLQVPAYVDKKGRLGTHTTNFDADTDITTVLDKNLSILQYIRSRGHIAEGSVDPKIAAMAKELGYTLEQIEDVDDLKDE